MYNRNQDEWKLTIVATALLNSLGKAPLMWEESEFGNRAMLCRYLQKVTRAVKDGDIGKANKFRMVTSNLIVTGDVSRTYAELEKEIEKFIETNLQNPVTVEDVIEAWDAEAVAEKHIAHCTECSVEGNFYIADVEEIIALDQDLRGTYNSIAADPNVVKMILGKYRHFVIFMASKYRDRGLYAYDQFSRFLSSKVITPLENFMKNSSIEC